MSTFCQRLCHKKHQRREVSGQKKAKIVNPKMESMGVKKLFQITFGISDELI